MCSELVSYAPDVVMVCLRALYIDGHIIGALVVALLNVSTPCSDVLTVKHPIQRPTPARLSEVLGGPQKKNEARHQA